MIRKPPRKDPRQRLPGIAVVVLLHIGIGYALLNGLGRTVMEQVLDAPLLVSLIEQPKPAQPPEPVLPVPPAPPSPKPPPAPRPELPKPAPTPSPIPAPAVEAPEPVSAVTTAPVPPQPAPAPPASPAPPLPAAPPATPPIAPVAVICTNHASVRSSVPYPAMARRRNVEGSVVAEFIVGTSGRVEEARIASSTHALFDEAVLDAVQRLRCTAQASPVRIRVPFEFSLK